jgi:hypothetical protein
MQSTSDGKKIWKIKYKTGKRITRHMRVCWKHFVNDNFVPLVCWFDGLGASHYASAARQKRGPEMASLPIFALQRRTRGSGPFIIVGGSRSPLARPEGCDLLGGQGGFVLHIYPRTCHIHIFHIRILILSGNRPLPT